MEGVQADMFQTMLRTKKSRGIKAPPPWSAAKELFPWPGNNKRCSNTDVNISYGLMGGFFQGTDCAVMGHAVGRAPLG